jgi:translation initiation factor IF-2
VLVQRGTLRVGDLIVAGAGLGPRARTGVRHRRAGRGGWPSTPVEVLGFNGTAGSRRSSGGGAVGSACARGHRLPR